MHEIRKIIYLSALLHDIGKFYQRADPDFAKKSKLLSKNILNLEGSICPLDIKMKTYTHKHVLWTAQFFEENEKLFSVILKNSGFTTDKLLRLAAIHHNPSNFLEVIIQKADHFSSGIDRTNSDNAWKEGNQEETQGMNSFKKVAMRSIFESINFSDSNILNNYKKNIPLIEISLSEDYFPKELNEINYEDKYRKLWNSFVEEISVLDSRSIDVFNETIYYLLEKYTTRIPSSTIHLPDVSLFDHLKTTAAFAISLYDYCFENNIDNISLIEDKPFLLIGGDVSGIQKFIYNIIAHGAAKNLKGRSFYLQLLVDTIVQYIINELNLYSGNIIYASGGSFYILAPNTSRVINKLSEIEKSLTQKLFDEHGTQISLVLDFIPFGENEIFSKSINEKTTNIGEIWSELVILLSKKKGKKLLPILKENYAILFESEIIESTERRDAITMEELKGKPEEYDGLLVNKSTKQQIELGKHLKSTNYWIVSKQKLSYFNANHSIEPLGLGIFHYFIAKDELHNKRDKLKDSADNVKVVYFNNEDFNIENIQKGVNNIYGFTWYGGNDYPKKDNDPKSFEQISGVESTEQKPNLTRLGVLRMDVDNLGNIFKNGFNPKMRTFSRYSTLSRNLDYFFKGYINAIWRDNKKFKEYTQIIYSGGDDLFIVGKWDILIEFATLIKDKFKLWTCNNPLLSISGGMASVSPKFPILKAAQFSELFEKSAKNHSYGTAEKNSFTFLSQRINTTNNSLEDLYFSFDWEHEMDYVIKLKNYIKNLIQEEALASGFASDILNLMEQAEFYYNAKENRYFPKKLDVIWLIAYKFKRTIKGKDENLKSFLFEWIKNVMTGKIDSLKETKYHSLQILAIASRWASLELRSSLTNKTI